MLKYSLQNYGGHHSIGHLGCLCFCGLDKLKLTPSNYKGIKRNELDFCYKSTMRVNYNTQFNAQEK